MKSGAASKILRGAPLAASSPDDSLSCRTGIQVVHRALNSTITMHQKLLTHCDACQICALGVHEQGFHLQFRPRLSLHSGQALFKRHIWLVLSFCLRLGLDPEALFHTRICMLPGRLALLLPPLLLPGSLLLLLRALATLLCVLHASQASSAYT